MIHCVRIARFNTEVNTTSGSSRALISSRAAARASSYPRGVRSTSTQPVKRFSRFQMLWPWRTSTRLPGFMCRSGSNQINGVDNSAHAECRGRAPLQLRQRLLRPRRRQRSERFDATVSAAKSTLGSARRSAISCCQRWRAADWSVPLARYARVGQHQGAEPQMRREQHVLQPRAWRSAASRRSLEAARSPRAANRGSVRRSARSARARQPGQSSPSRPRAQRDRRRPAAARGPPGTRRVAAGSPARGTSGAAADSARDRFPGAPAGSDARARAAPVAAARPLVRPDRNAGDAPAARASDDAGNRPCAATLRTDRPHEHVRRAPRSRPNALAGRRCHGRWYRHAQSRRHRCRFAPCSA